MYRILNISYLKLINDFFKLKFDKNLKPAGQKNKTSEAIREKVFF